MEAGRGRGGLLTSCEVQSPPNHEEHLPESPSSSVWLIYHLTDLPLEGGPRVIPLSVQAAHRRVEGAHLHPDQGPHRHVDLLVRPRLPAKTTHQRDGARLQTGTWVDVDQAGVSVRAIQHRGVYGPAQEEEGPRDVDGARDAVGGETVFCQDDHLAGASVFHARHTQDVLACLRVAHDAAAGQGVSLQERSIPQRPPRRDCHGTLGQYYGFGVEFGQGTGRR